MIRLRDVRLSAGTPDRRNNMARPVLNHVSCDVPQGGFRWLLGPSGAGKTTFLRALSLAIRPEHGEIDLLGAPTARAGRATLTRLRRRIGMIPQDLALLPDLSVYDNVALPLRLDRTAERIVEKEVGAILAWLRIEKLARTPTPRLSGGERQRTAIARALVKRPALLLADEPTNALDEAESLRLVHLFGELAELGTTVIMATHNPALPRQLPARTLILDGRGGLHEATS